MQFSLRDLLILFVFAAIFAWCSAQVGADNPVFWFTVVVSAIVSALYARAVHHQAYGLAVVVLGVSFAVAVLGFVVIYLILGMFSASVILLNLVLLSLALVGFQHFKPQSLRPILVVVTSCAAIAFLLVSHDVSSDVERMHDLRREYALISLNEQLAYEPATATVEPILVAAVKENLKVDDMFVDDWGRTRTLELLHSRRYEQFVRSQGFGMWRMPMPSERNLKLDTLRDIAFTSPNESDQSSDLLRYQAKNLAKSNPLSSIYHTSRLDFVDLETIGYVAERRTRVAGFQSHAASMSPTSNLDEQTTITLNRLELVSLLKYPEPRVYVLDQLPRMDQLSAKNAPTRSLDEFEAASLSQLRTAEDLVIDESQTPVRMLGSLRASSRCLDCHNVQRGELLGAFSYALTMGAK